MTDQFGKHLCKICMLRLVIVSVWIMHKFYKLVSVNKRSRPKSENADNDSKKAAASHITNSGLFMHI